MGHFRETRHLAKLAAERTPPPVGSDEHFAQAHKGRMQRIAFQNRPRLSRYRVECGAHGCDTQVVVRDPADARAQGWYRDKRGGYGWICPKCQEGDPLPVDQG